MALAVLQDFATIQRETMQVRAVEMAAQVIECLTDKHPGQNMNRVANGFMQWFAHAETLAQSRRQSWGYGMRV